MTTSRTSTAMRAVLIALALSLSSCGGDEEINAPPLASTPPVPAPPVVAPPVVVPPAVTPPCSAAPPLPAECSTVAFEVYSGGNILVDAQAEIWVEPDEGWGEPYLYWARHGILHPDQTGYFVTKPLPPATLTITSFAPPNHYLQPCAAIVKSPSSAVTRIELFPTTAHDTLEPTGGLRPSNATEPSLVGTIYEMTTDGRKPVSGAYMAVGYEDAWLYWWIDGPSIASTLSGGDGRFFFCRLPPDIEIYVTKPGFVDAFVHPGVVPPGVPFDIELRRTGL